MVKSEARQWGTTGLLRGKRKEKRAQHDAPYVGVSDRRIDGIGALSLWRTFFGTTNAHPCLRGRSTSPRSTTRVNFASAAHHIKELVSPMFLPGKHAGKVAHEHANAVDSSRRTQEAAGSIMFGEPISSSGRRPPCTAKS